MDTFVHISVSEIKQLLKWPSNTFCEADSRPIWFVEECKFIFVCRHFIILRSVSTILESCTVKVSKRRQNLDSIVRNNFRPISNLSYLSKIIERAVGVRLNKYILNSNRTESRQAAHITGHNTETALIRVKNNNMMCIDQR